MSRPKLLDLFACAGGAGTGYERAGLAVYAIDIAPQPHNPHPFHLGSVNDVLVSLLAGLAVDFTHPDGTVEWLTLDDFHAAHGSPPCQSHTDLQKQNKRTYLDFIPQTRWLLRQTGLPYVLENVEGAPLENPVMLCGAMFPGLRVYRHRLFESNLRLEVPEHPRHAELTFTHDKRKAHYGQPLDLDTMRVQVTGGGNAPVWAKAHAMGIDWMTGRELNEALPPAYTEHIGTQILAWMRSRGLEAA